MYQIESDSRFWDKVTLLDAFRINASLEAIDIQKYIKVNYRL